MEKKCGRCGSKEIDTPAWHTGWPNHGQIELGAASQSFAHLCGANIADENHFDAWKQKCGAVVKNEAQHVIFQWGPRQPYRLCYDCQHELFAIVGKFFGYGGAEIQKDNKVKI